MSLIHGKNSDLGINIPVAVDDNGHPECVDYQEPRYLVTPLVLGSSNADKVVDGVGTASLIPYFLRVTIGTNGGISDVTAALRLKNGYPDVKVCHPGEEIEFDVSNAPLLSNGDPVSILSVYWVAVGNTTSGPGTAAPANYTGNAAIIADSDTADANWQAQMIKDVYSSDDAVRRVRISMSDVLASYYAYVHREGSSYA